MPETFLLTQQAKLTYYIGNVNGCWWETKHELRTPGGANRFPSLVRRKLPARLSGYKGQGE